MHNARDLELMIAEYTRRALATPEGFREIAAEFGGIDVPRNLPPAFHRIAVAHAIALRVLGSDWYYELSAEHDGPVRIRIRGPRASAARPAPAPGFEPGLPLAAAA